MGSLSTYLRARKWDAPLKFPEASIPRGGKGNTVDLSDPGPSQLSTPLSDLPPLFPPSSMTPQLPYFPPPSAFSFFLPLFLWQGSQTMPEASLHSCVSGEAGDHKSEGWVAHLSERSSWPGLDQGRFLNSEQLSLEWCLSRHDQGAQGGRRKTVSHEVSK